MAEMVLKFPDGTTKPLCLFDSTLTDPLGVVLDEDLVVPAKHEVFKTARVRNPALNESILEHNMNLSGKGVLVARVAVQPKDERVPIQIINPGISPIKLYKGMSLGQLFRKLMMSQETRHLSTQSVVHPLLIVKSNLT